MEEWYIFENAGEKIKTAIQVFFVLNCIFFIILAFWLFSEEMFFWGFISLFLGPIYTWLTQIITYAFADMVENTQLANKQRAEIIKLMREDTFDDNMPTL